MAYAVQADIEALNPKRVYDTNSSPTTTELSGIIDNVAAEIDTVLASQGYTTPITIPSSFVTRLKLLNAQGAAALAEMGQFPDASGPGETPHGAVLLKAYQDSLQSLRDGEVPASLGKASTASPSSYSLRQGDDFPDPVFRKSSRDKDF